MWDEQVKYFSSRYTVVRFDARGYGQSEIPNEPYVPADDLHNLLAILRIDRATVIGLSMGGTIAIDYALAYPRAVSGLVVIAGSPGWLPYSEALTKRTAAIVAAGNEHGSRQLVDGWLLDPMLVLARTRPTVAAQMRTFLSRNAEGILRAPLMRPPNIANPRLSDLHMPMLVMVGDKDDPEIVERAHSMAREIAGAKIQTIKNADHMVSLERPRVFNRHLDAFLRNVR